MITQDEKLVEQVWEKAKVEGGYNPDLWRKDFAGAWIRRDFYGVLNDYGWEIDHKKPQKIGGVDSLTNLWPLHWKNNRDKADNYPKFTTCISSEFNRNVYKKQFWTWEK